LQSTGTEHDSLSVSQLNRQVKRLLESHFDYIWVEGEISNFACPSSGHWYFSLKDSGAQVRCAMFRNRNQLLRIRPENGQLVKIRCRVSLYEGRGEYQLITEFMELAGSGGLQIAFEELKQKLNNEGLFAPERKRLLPSAAKHIGVITSPTGAAIRDIVTVFKRRFPAIDISILPVLVQGAQSGASVSRAIIRANRLHTAGKVNFDALILSRGGGSIEDLWGFNEEQVARAIYESQIPVVSAVGHEVDFTISDFVSDVRAATPSAAAELLSPDEIDFARNLQKCEAALLRSVGRTIESTTHALVRARSNLRHPGERLRDQAQRLDGLEQRLRHHWQYQFSQKQHQLKINNSELWLHSPENTLKQFSATIKSLKYRIHASQVNKLKSSQQQLTSTAQLLNTVSPLATLQRGYSIITDSSGEIIRRASDLTSGAKITAQLNAGKLDCTVDKVKVGN
jgi:exodeoxyribonuclease VII large subunit